MRADMKARFYCVFLFLMALVDGTIVFLFPVDYQYISISFVPHLCIAALLLSVWKRGYMDRMLMGFLFGILYDAFFLNCFSFHIFLYPLLTFLCGIFQEKMDEDNQILLIVTLILVFLYDLLPFGYHKFTKTLSVSLIRWFIHFELATILIHIVLIAALIYIFNVYERYETIRRIRQQRQEKKKYHNLRLSRK